MYSCLICLCTMHVCAYIHVCTYIHTYLCSGDCCATSCECLGLTVRRFRKTTFPPLPPPPSGNAFRRVWLLKETGSRSFSFIFYFFAWIALFTRNVILTSCAGTTCHARREFFVRKLQYFLSFEYI